jgi:hypothetical protein
VQHTYPVTLTGGRSLYLMDRLVLLCVLYTPPIGSDHCTNSNSRNR